MRRWWDATDGIRFVFPVLIAAAAFFALLIAGVIA